MKTIIIIILVALLSTRVLAQAGRPDLSRWSVNLEAVTQTTGAYAGSIRLPGIRMQFSGLKGLQLGGEYVYFAKKHGQLFQNGALMRYGSGNEAGWMAATSVGYRQGIAAAFLELQAGIGYLQTTFRGGRELQGREGDFFTEKFKVGGLTPTLLLGVGYCLGKKWKIYVRHYHHAQIQTEFNPGGVRLFRSLNMGVGLSI